MKNLFRFLLLFFATSLFAQNSQRFFQKIEFKNNTAEISVNDGLYQVKFYTPETVSYTHLDVYKRQKSNKSPIKNKTCASCFISSSHAKNLTSLGLLNSGVGAPKC